MGCLSSPAHRPARAWPAYPRLCFGSRWWLL